MDMDIQPPSSSLPPLCSITMHTPATLTPALANLRALYWPLAAAAAVVSTSKPHVEYRAPDSGYASAEEDEDGDEESAEEQIMLLRSDTLERAFAVRWLTGFIARTEAWTAAGELEEDRARIVEEAATLLAFSADTQADGTLAREFSFAVEGGGSVVVALTDEPYDHDHESVGLQTWGSACVFAGLLCATPVKYLGLGSSVGGRTIRILELGAGTGLLSLVVAKLQPLLHADLEVVATDFHPAVLANLRRNVARNAGVVRVERLDWANTPVLEESDKFDVILAADVIYDARHGVWIKNCAERMLRRKRGREMWLIIPRRPTRTGELEGVDDVFCMDRRLGLKIVEVEDVPRCNSVGRADEDGYKLFRIGWEA